MDLNFKTGEELFQFLLVIILFLFTIVLLVVVLNIFMVLKRLNNKLAGVENQDVVSSEGWWKRFSGTDVAVDKEETIMLSHNYDGIRELDNHLPPWWLGLFYGGIVFGIIYLLNFHVFNWSPLSGEEYENEVTEAQKAVEEYQAKAGNSIDENNVELADANGVAKGKEIFTGKCAACHGMAGEGGVGPNLTDAYWLHGGDVKAVFKTIKYGVPQKGMIAWEAQLKPNEMQNVASYILSIQGSKPANAKEPQGELVEAGAATAVATDSTAAQ